MNVLMSRACQFSVYECVNKSLSAPCTESKMECSFVEKSTSCQSLMLNAARSDMFSGNVGVYSDITNVLPITLPLKCVTCSNRPNYKCLPSSECQVSWASESKISLNTTGVSWYHELISWIHELILAMSFLSRDKPSEIIRRAHTHLKFSVAVPTCHVLHNTFQLRGV
jgi:hypothetical protein